MKDTFVAYTGWRTKICMEPYDLKNIFGPEKGEQLQQFWDNEQHERAIVFAQAKDPVVTPAGTI